VHPSSNVVSLAFSTFASLLNAVYLNIYPVVTSENRLEWEQCSMENNYWVNESIHVQEEDNTFTGPIALGIGRKTMRFMEISAISRTTYPLISRHGKLTQ
jgi:hypothetical protein